MTQFSK